MYNSNVSNKCDRNIVAEFFFTLDATNNSGYLYMPSDNGRY